MLRQLTGQEKSNGRLNFPRRDGGTLVVVRQSGSFGGDALKDVVHEGIHDGHGFAANAGVGMHLLEHLVDVDEVGLLSPFFVLLVGISDGFGFAGGLFGTLTGWFGRHTAENLLL